MTARCSSPTRKNNKLRRIEPTTRVITTLARVDTPLGMDIGGDGSIYVVDGKASRVLRVNPSGERIGFVGTVFRTPYTSRPRRTAPSTCSKPTLGPPQAHRTERDGHDDLAPLTRHRPEAAVARLRPLRARQAQNA